MKSKIFCSTLLVVLFLSLDLLAQGGAGYWDIELPVMKGAVNLSEKKDEKFSTLSKNYKLKIEDPAKVLDFYDTFFESIGWKNPIKAFSGVPETSDLWNYSQRGWGGYRLDIDSEGNPGAFYQVLWNPKEIPAIGILRLKLADYSDGFYSSTVEVKITPKIDIEPLSSQIMELFRDPKNYFELSRVVKGNPLEIDKINLSDMPQGNITDPVAIKYFSIVKEIIAKYKEFHVKYNQ
jgi:hypothetical protein